MSKMHNFRNKAFRGGLSVVPKIWSPKNLVHQKFGPQKKHLVPKSQSVVPKCGPQVWFPSVFVPPSVVHKCPKLAKWSSSTPPPISPYSMYPYITSPRTHINTHTNTHTHRHTN